MKNNVDKTLENILALIDKDVNIISSNFSEIQLDTHTAQSLCRYATTLSGIKEDKQKESVKEKANLSKLSTEELIQLYNKTAKNEPE